MKKKCGAFLGAAEVLAESSVVSLCSAKLIAAKCSSAVLAGFLIFLSSYSPVGPATII